MLVGMLFGVGTQLAFAAMSFPIAAVTSDQDDILKEYPAYLSFVLEVGRDVDHASAVRLGSLYARLKTRSPQDTARFLKGLRFEMAHKLQLMGANPQSITTQNPTIRRWVGRYIKEWSRECDEHLYRSYARSAQLARKD